MTIKPFFLEKKNMEDKEGKGGRKKYFKFFLNKTYNQQLSNHVQTSRIVVCKNIKAAR